MSSTLRIAEGGKWNPKGIVLLFLGVALGSSSVKLVFKDDLHGFAIRFDCHLAYIDDLAVTLVSFFQHVLAVHFHRDAGRARIALVGSVGAVQLSHVGLAGR